MYADCATENNSFIELTYFMAQSEEILWFFMYKHHQIILNMLSVIKLFTSLLVNIFPFSIKTLPELRFKIWSKKKVTQFHQLLWPYAVVCLQELCCSCTLDAYWYFTESFTEMENILLCQIYIFEFFQLFPKNNFLNQWLYTHFCKYQFIVQY